MAVDTILAGLPADLRATVPADGAAFGSRSWFPDLAAGVYLNHAAISPPSLLVRAVLRAVADDYATRGVGAFMTWIDQRQRLRTVLAGLVGAEPDDLGLVPNTSHGVLTIALCMPWRRGDRVLCFRGEFPTNVTPWQRAADTFGLELDFEDLTGFGDGSGDGLARVEARLKAGLRLVAVSAVQFQTGLAMPLRQLAELCHRHDAQLFVDAIQAVGIVPLDLRGHGIDYLACGSHKWLMGTEGCGFIAVHPDRIGQLVPRVAAWLSHEDGLGFLFEGAGQLRYDRPIRKRADFVELGAPNTLGFAALEAGAAPLADLGVAQVHAHAQAFIDGMESGLLQRGFHSQRAPLAAARSGILSLQAPAGVDPVALQLALSARGISCALPDGWLRLAPHWPNSLDQIGPLLAAVDAALADPAVGA